MLRLAALVAVAIAALLGAGSSVAMQDDLDSTVGAVSIAIESDAPQFREAAAACASVLRSAGREVSVVRVASLEQASGLAAQPGVIVAVGSRVAAAMARTLPDDRPLFYCLVSNPERAGLLGRKATSGVSANISVHDQFAMIRTLHPRATRIGVLYRSEDPASSAIADMARQAAPDSVSFVAVDVSASRSLSEAIAKLMDEDVDVVWTGPDAAVFDGAVVKALLMQSLKQGVPVYGFSMGMVKAGAAFGLATSPSRNGETVASLILRSALDVHTTCEPDLGVNRVVIERLGLDIDDVLIDDADVVYGE